MFNGHLVARRFHHHQQQQQQVRQTVTKPADPIRPLSTHPMLPNLSRNGLVFSMMTLIWRASARADQVARSVLLLGKSTVLFPAATRSSRALVAYANDAEFLDANVKFITESVSTRSQCAPAQVPACLATCWISGVRFPAEAVTAHTNYTAHPCLMCNRQ